MPLTSTFHMRRAQRLFERQGLQVVPFPVDFQACGHWAGPIWRYPTSGFRPLGPLLAAIRLAGEVFVQ